MRILLVDDHQILRESVAEFLKQEPFTEDVLDVGSVEEARATLVRFEADVLVTDLEFPAESGKDLLRWVHNEHPDTGCICMTMHAEVPLLRDTLSLGARGFVTKSSGYDELVSAVKCVSAGRTYLDQTMLDKVLAYLQRDPEAGYDHAGSLGELSRRERDIFYLLLEDRDIHDIAASLFISPKTVENHRSNIYRKLGVNDRLGLFRFARDRQLLE
jgi:DNA-binding NarL/FixJ family response regulator